MSLHFYRVREFELSSGYDSEASILSRAAATTYQYNVAIHKPGVSAESAAKFRRSLHAVEFKEVIAFKRFPYLYTPVSETCFHRYEFIRCIPSGSPAKL